MLLFFFLHIIIQRCYSGDWALWHVLPNLYSLNWRVIAKAGINNFNLSWLFSVESILQVCFFQFDIFFFFSLLAYWADELLCFEIVTCLIGKETAMIHHTLLQSVHHFLNIQRSKRMDRCYSKQPWASWKTKRKSRLPSPRWLRLDNRSRWRKMADTATFNLSWNTKLMA